MLVVSPTDRAHFLRVRYPQLAQQVLTVLSNFVVDKEMVSDLDHSLDSVPPVPVAATTSSQRCVTGERNDPENTFCSFPFEFDGQTFHDCAPLAEVSNF
jgi:hypothetical protein